MRRMGSGEGRHRARGRGRGGGRRPRRRRRRCRGRGCRRREESLEGTSFRSASRWAGHSREGYKGMDRLYEESEKANPLAIAILAWWPDGRTDRKRAAGSAKASGAGASCEVRRGQGRPWPAGVCTGRRGLCQRRTRKVAYVSVHIASIARYASTLAEFDWHPSGHSRRAPRHPHSPK